MAHVKLYRDAENRARIEIDGVDLTAEVIADTLRFRSIGSGELAEVGIELQIAVSRLDLGEMEDVDATLLVGNTRARMASGRSY